MTDGVYGREATPKEKFVTVGKAMICFTDAMHFINLGARYCVRRVNPVPQVPGLFHSARYSSVSRSGLPSSERVRGLPQAGIHGLVQLS